MKNSWQLFIPIYGVFAPIFLKGEKSPFNPQNFSAFIYFGSAFVQAVSFVIVFLLIYLKTF